MLRGSSDHARTARWDGRCETMEAVMCRPEELRDKTNTLRQTRREETGSTETKAADSTDPDDARHPFPAGHTPVGPSAPYNGHPSPPPLCTLFNPVWAPT